MLVSGGRWVSGLESREIPPPFFQRGEIGGLPFEKGGSSGPAVRIFSGRFSLTTSGMMKSRSSPLSHTGPQSSPVKVANFRPK